MEKPRGIGHCAAINITKAQHVDATYNVKVDKVTPEGPRSQFKEAPADKRWYKLSIKKNNGCNRLK